MDEDDKKKPKDDYRIGNEFDPDFPPRMVVCPGRLGQVEEKGDELCRSDLPLHFRLSLGEYWLSAYGLRHPMIGPLDNREDEQFYRRPDEDYRVPELANVTSWIDYARGVPVTNQTDMPGGMISGARDAEVDAAPMSAQFYVPPHSYDFWGITSTDRIDNSLFGSIDDAVDDDPEDK